MKNVQAVSRPHIAVGFTLVELLVAIAIIAVLGAIGISSLGSARERAAAATCASNLRQLGAAVQLYCADNGGAFPRSFHSAGSHREPGWVASVTSYLGRSEDHAAVGKIFRCPADTNADPAAGSYGLNVFFELSPDGDDYVGAPASWRTSLSVPAPSRTILLAEVRSASGGVAADHFMCHQWSSAGAAKNAVAHASHTGRANYLFVDGHVERLLIDETFSSRRKNLWNPSLAGLP